MRAHLLFLFASSLLLFSCAKETEQFETETLADYLPSKTGKYITYRIDSTVFTNFGTVTHVRSYQEKHEVQELTSDNLGRPSYRVFRFLRDTAGVQPWRPSGSYLITPTTNSIEVIENNLRFLKLAAPVKLDNSWKGNRFLPADTYNAYTFSNDDNMADWDFSYKAVGETMSFKGQTIDSIITVEHINESANVPVTQPQAYGYINYSVEKYAKHIGLVFQELTMWEYQPNTGGGSGYKNGFGVKRSMIDHN